MVAEGDYPGSCYETCEVVEYRYCKLETLVLRLDILVYCRAGPLTSILLDHHI